METEAAWEVNFSSSACWASCLSFPLDSGGGGSGSGSGSGPGQAYGTASRTPNLL